MAQDIRRKCAGYSVYSFNYLANEHSLFLTPVDEKEIMSYIEHIKPNNAPGLDGINGNLNR